MASLAALTVAVGVLATPHALLGSSDDSGQSEPAELTTSEPVDQREAAKRAFDRGLTAVAGGEFNAAVASFEQAYTLRPHPVTLFNLALALEKAGRLPEAWELFDDVIDVVESDAERREIRRHMLAIANEIAIVEINAQPKRRLCIDGFAMPEGKTSTYRLSVDPGRHALLLDDHQFEFEFAAGERRVLLIDDTTKTEERRQHPASPTLLGVSIGTGTLALGLGLGAAISTHDGSRTGLAAGAAGSAGAAVATGLAVLLLETRQTRKAAGKRSSPAGHDCPGGGAATEQRLDLRLKPTIERPASFADAITPPMPVHAMSLGRPTTQTPSPFPHPRAIAPPRR
jgi:hypothetical protein